MRRSSLLAASLFSLAAVSASAQPAPSSPPALSYTQPLAPKSVQLVQQRLREQGAYRGRIDGIWGRDKYIDERTVDVHIGRLRKALNRGREIDPIRTVRGAGYALNDRFARTVD